MNNKYKIWLKITSAGYIYIGFADKEPYRTDKKHWSSEAILYNQNNSIYHPDVVQMINLMQIKYSNDYKTFIEQIQKLIKCGYLNAKKIYCYGDKAEEAVLIQKLFNSYCCKKLFPHFTWEETGTNINKEKIKTIEVKTDDNIMMLLL